MLSKPRSFRTCLAALALAIVPAHILAVDGQPNSSARHFVRVWDMPAKELAESGLPASAMIDYGSFVWLDLSGEELADLASSNIKYTEEFSAFAIQLGGLSFDPLQGEPVAPSGLGEAQTDGNDLHLIQLNGPTKADWLATLDSAGLEIVQYIHPYTYVVWGDSNTRRTAETNAFVRWSGSFLPAYRLQPSYRNLPDGRAPVRVLLYRGADTVTAVRRIEALGGTLTDTRKLNHIFEVAGFDLATNQLADVAAVPGVYSVHTTPTDGGLRGEMSNQVNVNNVDEFGMAFPGYSDWLTAVGLTGSGVTIANVDGGVQDNHPDLVDRLVSCSGVTCGGGSTSSHGTHTAGIMAADGSSGTVDGDGFLRGLGVAPGANLVEQVYSPFFQQTGGMLLLMTDSQANGASLSGNSWGPAGSPRGYDDDTLQVDIGVRDADPETPGNQPLSYVLSFMNGYGGTSSQGTPDEGKNIFTIGSTKMQTSGGAQILELDDLSNNSAHGPALDGRIIPHMVAPGCRVDSSDSGSSYDLKCGTSMASPHVSGAVAVFIEYYRGLPDYVRDPSPAMIKAAFVAAARDLSGNEDADGGTLGHPFDSKQGWGRMDLEALVDPQLGVRYFDDPTIFDNTGEEWSTTISAEDPGQPMRIILAWTDAPGHGLGGTTPAWNNNLDLIVESSASSLRGNNFGSDGWSVAGGTADTRNNTEGVFIGPTAADSYTIRVLAGDISSDAIPGEGDTTDQDFALVCYNCAAQPGFSISATPEQLEICVPDDAAFDIDVDSVLGFSDPITLDASGHPAGTTIEFSSNPVAPPGTSVLTIANTGAATAGDYTILIEGEDQAADQIRSTSVGLSLFTSAPAAVGLVSPVDGASDVSAVPTFEWSAAEQAASYDLEVATDAEFSAIVYTATTVETIHIPDDDFDFATEYFWRVAPGNICGSGNSSAVFSFTTRDLSPVLLVDDDDNNPDVRSFYVGALNALDVDFDVWDTQNSDNEPDANLLSNYNAVVWFTGDEFGGAAGPGPAGESALASFLDDGGCVLISSQDYYFDRGLTAFMTAYLGVASMVGDVSHDTVTGTGSFFDGFGPYVLDYPFSNFSDSVEPAATAEVAFVGDQGNAAVSMDGGTFHTMFLGYPFEAIRSASEREDLLGAVLAICGIGGNGCETTALCPNADVSCDGIADGFDIGIVRTETNWLTPTELATDPRADVNDDGMIDGFDIAAIRTPACWLK